jgi:hypothetical protein
LDRTTEELAYQMTKGISVPFRTYRRVCEALLSGDLAVAVNAAQWQTNAAMLGASGGLDAAAAMVMMA